MLIYNPYANADYDSLLVSEVNDSLDSFNMSLKNIIEKHELTPAETIELQHLVEEYIFCSFLDIRTIGSLKLRAKT